MDYQSRSCQSDSDFKVTHLICRTQLEDMDYPNVITKVGEMEHQQSNKNPMEETIMKSSTKDRTKGKFQEVKGKVKEEVGKLTSNPRLEAEGKIEKGVGKVQQVIGKVKNILGK